MDGMCGRKVLALDFETNAEELQNFLYGETTAEELSEKYGSATGEYSYKNSESYKQNYQDAEAAVGKGTYIQKTGKSMPTLVETPSSQGTGTAAAGGIAADGLTDQGANAAAGTGTASGAGNDAAGGTAADAQAAANTASSLGVVESSTTDPATGIVTIVYYNEATGVRTAVASNPVNGATTVTAADTGNGTTVTAHSADGVTVDASGAAADSGVVQGQ